MGIVLTKKNISTTIDIERLANVLIMISNNFYSVLASLEKRSSLPIVIKINEIKRLVTLLLAKAERAGFGEVEIVRDEYWSIEPKVMYDLDTDPTPEIRSLSADWRYLQSVLAGERIPTMQDLTRLASILKAVGDAIDYSPHVIDWLVAV